MKLQPGNLSVWKVHCSSRWGARLHHLWCISKFSTRTASCCRGLLKVHSTYRHQVVISWRQLTHTFWSWSKELQRAVLLIEQTHTYGMKCASCKTSMQTYTSLRLWTHWHCLCHVSPRSHKPDPCMHTGGPVVKPIFGFDLLTQSNGITE